MVRTTTYAGMGGSGRWKDNEVPDSYSKMVLYLWPNGDAPLTAMLSMMQNENVYHFRHSWWTKAFPRRFATITGVYQDSAMTAAYAGGGVEGTTVYVKMSEAHIEHAIVGQQVLFRNEDNMDYDTVGRVYAVEGNGANSKLTVKLIEDDDNCGADNVSDCTTLIYLSNMHAQGATMPGSVKYMYEEFENRTQIIRNSLQLSRTKMGMKPMTGHPYEQEKTDTLQLHSIDVENAILFSKMSESIDPVTGEPITSVNGIIPFIREHNPNGVSSFHLEPDFAGATWEEGGEEWLNEMVARSCVFRSTMNGGRDSNRKVGWTSDYVLNAIARLVRNGAHYNIYVRERAYGINVVEWMLPNGTIVDLRVHPMFNLETTLNGSMLLMEPAYIKKRPFNGADMLFFGKGQTTEGGYQRPDGINEEYLSEFTLEIHYPQKHEFLSGFGVDNELTP